MFFFCYTSFVYSLLTLSEVGHPLSETALPLSLTLGSTYYSNAVDIWDASLPRNRKEK